MNVPPSRSLQSIGLISTIAMLFVVLFFIVVWLVDRQQTKVSDETSYIQSELLPDILHIQRRARNLEKIRGTGDQLLSSISQGDRQTALLHLTLMANHPSVLDDENTAQIVGHALQFLTDASQATQQQTGSQQDWRGKWQPIANQLSRMADDAMTQSSQMIAKEMEVLSDISKVVRFQLFITMALVALFLLMFFWFLYRNVISPLMQINQALIAMGSNKPVPSIPATGLKEIHAVQSALIELQKSIQDSAASRRELEYLAHHDVLTGLPNRRFFIQSATDQAQAAYQSGKSVTVGLVDIDLFKRINDEHGHAVGDSILSQFAKIFVDAFRDSDILCRYGGEEFAFVLIGTDLIEAKRLAEQLRLQVLRNKFRMAESGDVVSLSISLGLARMKEDGFDRALIRADDALYKAKQSGRNKTVVQD